MGPIPPVEQQSMLERTHWANGGPGPNGYPRISHRFTQADGRPGCVIEYVDSAPAAKLWAQALAAEVAKSTFNITNLGDGDGCAQDGA